MEKSLPDAAPDDLALEPGEEAAAAADSYRVPDVPLTPDQIALFDLDGVTVAFADEQIRAEYAAAGETAEARKQTYDATTIRQIVLYYDAGEYAEILTMLERLMDATATTSHTEALTRLLKEWSAREPR